MSTLFPQSIISKGRLETLSDGVFAITMTLMILDIKVPDNSMGEVSLPELTNALVKILISAEAYVMSFIILGIFWVRQQLQLNLVKTVDVRVLFVNIFFLLVIGFVPFSVSLIRHYPDYEISYIIYITNLILISFILFIHWFHILKTDNLIPDELRKSSKKQFMFLSIVPLLIFVIALCITFVDKRMAILIIYLDPLFYIIYRRFNKNIVSSK